jgi:hypothetical protein
MDGLAQPQADMGERDTTSNLLARRLSADSLKAAWTVPVRGRCYNHHITSRTDQHTYSSTYSSSRGITNVRRRSSFVSICHLLGALEPALARLGAAAAVVDGRRLFRSLSFLMEFSFTVR